MTLRPIIFLLVLSFIVPSAFSKDYTVPRVVIDAVIRADGSVDYREHRTYLFDGRFSEADYLLSRSGFDEITDIVVSENGESYRLNDSKRSGTYRVRQQRRSVDIIWNYAADDEERTFTISFTLHGAVIRGPEHAEFFWTFLSDRWETGTEELEVNLRFAEAAATDGIHHFLRGRTDGVEVDMSGEGIRLHGRDFSRRHSLAMRTVFPAGLVPDAPVTHPDYSLADVLAEEEQRAIDERDAQLRRERRAEIWSLLALFFALLSLAFFGMLYARFRDNKPALHQAVPDRLYEIPTDHPPALASLFLPYAHAGGHHLVATLFDLCSRGYYRIVQGEPVKRRFQSPEVDYDVLPGDAAPDAAELRPWERDLLTLIEERRREGEATIKKIFDLSKGDRQKWFTKWSETLRADVKEVGMYHEDNPKAVAANVLLQLPILALGALALAYAGPIGAIPMGVSVMALILTDLLRHRTSHGEELYRRWNAYRSTLMKEDPSRLSGSIEKHFPYAVAFGATNNRTQTLVQVAQPHEFFWLMTITGEPVSPAALTKSVTAMTTSVTTAVATGTGATVGVAGGGAGGGAR